MRITCYKISCSICESSFMNTRHDGFTYDEFYNPIDKVNVLISNMISKAFATYHHVQVAKSNGRKTRVTANCVFQYTSVNALPECVRFNLNVGVGITIFCLPSRYSFFKFLGALRIREYRCKAFGRSLNIDPLIISILPTKVMYFDQLFLAFYAAWFTPLTIFITDISVISHTHLKHTEATTLNSR